MKTVAKVYIGASLDGYIADKNGGLDWLHSVPNPDQSDFGFADFMNSVDALLMGRVTFETVAGFDCEWPYTKPVFVLSNSLESIPEEYAGKVKLVKGELRDILSLLNSEGYSSLYIDGGSTIQSFLKEDLIDEISVSTIPILLGGGSSLFGDLIEPLQFDLVSSEVLVNQIVKTTYKRKR